MAKKEGSATGMSDKAGTSKLQILTGALKIHHMTSSSPLRTEVGVVMFHGTRGATVTGAGTAQSVQRDTGPSPSEPLGIKVNHVMTSEEREHCSDKEANHTWRDEICAPPTTDVPPEGFVSLFFCLTDKIF